VELGVGNFFYRFTGASFVAIIAINRPKSIERNVIATTAPQRMGDALESIMSVAAPAPTEVITKKDRLTTVALWKFSIQFP
jgi:hypothetical protein